MFDIAVVGAGPAGLSAAINARARNKRVVVLGRKPDTTALYRAEQIDNHLGMPHMKGQDMQVSFLAHAREAGVELREGRVLQIIPMGDYYALNVENEFVEARAVILATGVSKGKTIPGENELLGKGVSYCATCDGMLYRGKAVAVVGEIEEAVEDANFLAEICQPVYYVTPGDVPVGLSEKIQVIQGKPAAVMGDAFVESLQVGDQSFPVQGVFFIKAAVPMANLLEGLQEEDGHLLTGRKGETSIPGVFAAGDCTGGPYQISKALGEGLVAGQEAVKYLARMEKAGGGAL